MRKPLIAVVLLLTLICGAPASATDQKRSDQIVGHWKSQSGVDLILVYTGDPATIGIQVYPSPGLVKGKKEYTATWESDSTFYYTADGSRINGTVDGGNTIRVKSTTSGWSSVWRRK